MKKRRTLVGKAMAILLTGSMLQVSGCGSFGGFGSGGIAGGLTGLIGLGAVPLIFQILTGFSGDGSE